LKAIKVENLSKAYQLGEIGTGTLSRDLERWFAKIRGKEDPFLKIGETNDRTSKGTSDVVWSLKDLNFEINEGDAVGIIGRNGAGKSTLLKILSRVTSPTTGNIKVKGRIASLLEVGTGFHPELTGRENIYLNGAILGMRKKEIAKQFDAIVDFSGVERYVDTPVKRYSSGMYVRLAFAVAAHLDSEILIVDEVLAVGDAEFQKKCLGKMGEVSKGQGRTVLFVSHNMDSIKSLCNCCLLLNNGIIKYNGNVNQGLSIYKKVQKHTIKNEFLKTTGSDKDVYFNHVFFRTSAGNVVYFGEPVEIMIEIFSLIEIQNLECSFQIFDTNNVPIAYNWMTTSYELRKLVGRKGCFKIKVLIPSLRLYKGEYYFGFYLSDPRGKIIYERIAEVFSFEVNMGTITNEWGWAENACKYIENIGVDIVQ
jgi:lipopolysaccharide transport system ATP-binding protein